MCSFPTPAPTVDAGLEPKVLHFLKDQFFHAMCPVTAEVAEGTVTLRGRVKSFYRRQVLVHGCRRIPGVTSVIDEMRVEA